MAQRFVVLTTQKGQPAQTHGPRRARDVPQHLRRRLETALQDVGIGHEHADRRRHPGRVLLQALQQLGAGLQAQR